MHPPSTTRLLLELPTFPQGQPHPERKALSTLGAPAIERLCSDIVWTLPLPQLNPTRSDPILLVGCASYAAVRVDVAGASVVWTARQKSRPWWSFPQRIHTYEPSFARRLDLSLSLSCLPLLVRTVRYDDGPAAILSWILVSANESNDIESYG